MAPERLTSRSFARLTIAVPLAVDAMHAAMSSFQRILFHYLEGAN